MAERETISTLNHLIETCRDGEQGFKNAAEHVKNDGVRSLFSDFARERATFAAELSQEVQRLGGTPDEGGSVSGALHRGWMDVKSAVTRDDATIVAEAERGEDSAVKAYREALQQPLPPSAESLVQRQYAQVQDAHDRVRALELEQKGTKAR